MKKTLVIIAGITGVIVILLYSQLVFGESLVAKDTTGIYLAADGEAEMTGHRTRSFKKFIKGKSRRIAGQIGPIHYRADPFSDVEDYKEIDLTINLTPSENWNASMETSGYQVRFWQSRQIAGKTVKYIAQFRRAGKWLAMAPLALLWENDAGRRELINKPVADIIPIIDNNAYQVTWTNCFGSGIHYRYNVRPDEFFKTVIIDNKTDLPDPDDYIPPMTGPGLKLTVVLGISWHSQSKAANGFAGSIVPDEIPNDTDVSVVDEELPDSDRFAYQDESLRETFWIQKPKAWDSAEERHEIDMTWRLRRRGNRVFAALSVSANALNAAQVEYPVMIDVDMTEEEVGADNDDALKKYLDTTGYFPSIEDAIVGRISTTAGALCTGQIFRTIPIPNAAIVTASSMSLFASANRSNDLSTKIRCLDADTVSTDLALEATWDSYFPGNVTTAFRDYSSVGNFTGSTWETVPDTGNFNSPLQEVFDRGGWVSGNHILVFWDDYDNRTAIASTRDRHFFHHDRSSGSNPPKLNISYDEPVSGGAQVISIQGN